MGEFASASKWHRDKVGSRLTNCKLLHIPLLLMGLSLRCGVLQLVITATVAEHSGPFCAFEGVWYDWEDDETITLGCLGVKGNIREGSYSSAMGPRATSNFSMSGAYDIAGSFMQVIGKDRQGKNVKFTRLIYVEDPEYPTQMIVIDEKGEGSFYIWQRKE